MCIRDRDSYLHLSPHLSAEARLRAKADAGRGRNSRATLIPGEGQGTVPPRHRSSRSKPPHRSRCLASAFFCGERRPWAAYVWRTPAVGRLRHSPQSTGRGSAPPLRRPNGTFETIRFRCAERTLAFRININAKLAALGKRDRRRAERSRTRGHEDLRAFRATRCV